MSRRLWEASKRKVLGVCHERPGTGVWHALGKYRHMRRPLDGRAPRLRCTMKNGIDRRKLIVGLPALLASSSALAATRKRGTETLSRCVSQSSELTHNTKAAGASQLSPRPVFSAEDQQSAIIPGFPNVRFWANSEEDYARAVPSQLGPWLALSTGAEDGAYGAGFLNGWTASGKRPEFSVVTGVSSGAIIAVYAFAGPKYDAILRKAYTSVRAADIFEVRATSGKHCRYLAPGTARPAARHNRAARRHRRTTSARTPLICRHNQS